MSDFSPLLYRDCITIDILVSVDIESPGVYDTAISKRLGLYHMASCGISPSFICKSMELDVVTTGLSMESNPSSNIQRISLHMYGSLCFGLFWLCYQSLVG